MPYLSAQTAGNLNIVVVGWNDSTSAVSSITDSKGNTYSRAVGPTVGTKLTQSIYYAKNIAAGSNTVSVTFNTAVLFPDVRVLEYSGADTANPLDATAAAAGTSLNTNSGPASTTSLNELIFGAGTTFNGYYPASGFTQRVLTNFGDMAEDAAVASMGTYSVTAPLHLFRSVGDADGHVPRSRCIHSCIYGQRHLTEFGTGERRNIGEDYRHGFPVRGRGDIWRDSGHECSAA